jgi:sec-independent protein translocase protein TatB
MFDFDATKLMIVGVLALIVLGPNELPRVMRQLGQLIGKMRRMAGEFQGQFMDAMREAELDDIRKEVNKLGDAAKLTMPTLDPAAELRKAAEGAVATPTGLSSGVSSGVSEPMAEGPGRPLDLNLPPVEPHPPVTSEDLAAAFEAAPEAAPAAGEQVATAKEVLAKEAAAKPAAADPAAPKPAADAFYLRPGAARVAQTAGVQLEEGEEFTFRRAPTVAPPKAPEPLDGEAPAPYRGAGPTSA